MRKTTFTHNIFYLNILSLEIYYEENVNICRQQIGICQLLNYFVFESTNATFKASSILSTNLNLSPLRICLGISLRSF
jgi:hypothetical protein